MSQALTTNQLIELVKQRRATELEIEQKQKELEPVPIPSKCKKMMKSIQKMPNKLFWSSSIMVAIIGIVITAIFYHSQWANNQHAEEPEIILTKTNGSHKEVNTGHKPVFTVFVIGFILVCNVFI